MPVCPICNTQNVERALVCTNCGAHFTGATSVLPTVDVENDAPIAHAAGDAANTLAAIEDPDTRFESIGPTGLLGWSLKILLGAPGLGMLGIGLGMASQRSNDTAKLWQAACGIWIALLVYSFFRQRTRSLLVVSLLGCVLGFSSCAANFKWYGG